MIRVRAWTSAVPNGDVGGDVLERQLGFLEDVDLHADIGDAVLDRLQHFVKLGQGEGVGLGPTRS